MTEWLLVFVHSTFIGVTQPMTLDDCLKWQARHKPEQRAVCIRVTQTPMGPYVERRP